jgi:hypothetical protein
LKRGMAIGVAILVARIGRVVARRKGHA